VILAAFIAVGVSVQGRVAENNVSQHGAAAGVDTPFRLKRLVFRPATVYRLPKRLPPDALWGDRTYGAT
jgi:hypothetical protein